MKDLLNERERGGKRETGGNHRAIPPDKEIKTNLRGLVRVLVLSCGAKKQSPIIQNFEKS